jgi:riboflavin kinase
MHLKGTVSSGLGRAAVFMSQSHYQDQFRQIIGATAWPGTLNVHVENKDLCKYIALRQKAGIDTLDLDSNLMDSVATIDTSSIEDFRIRGFLREGRSFGGATAFRAEIYANNSEKIPCAILIPDLTRHVEVIEVIADLFLREGLNLEDGSIVNLDLL